MRVTIPDALHGLKSGGGTIALAFIILTMALRRVVLGLAMRLAAAWATSNVFRSFVFGVQPTDARVYTEVGCFVAFVGAVAAFVPALRAARLDPIETLRRE